MDDIADFEEFIEHTKRSRDQIGLRRYLRDNDNPFEKYTVEEFYSRYRFKPETVKSVLVPLVAPYLAKPTRRGMPFAPEVMVLGTLRYYATGTCQNLGAGGDVVNICQQSMSRIVIVVSSLLASQLKNVIKFPPPAELPDVRKEFFNIASFPGLIGCLGCMHVRIKNPGGGMAEVFRNSNGWLSINVQAVTGPKLQFYDLVVRWPGSCHSSFIYNYSTLKQRLQANQLQGILLGDSGYELTPILMTPYASLNSPAQERYNRSHSQTRKTMDQAFAIWKKRFPCLQKTLPALYLRRKVTTQRILLKNVNSTVKPEYSYYFTGTISLTLKEIGLSVKLETIVAVICACATLQNLAIAHNDHDLDPTTYEEDIFEPVPNEAIPDDPESEGFLARENFVLSYFNN